MMMMIIIIIISSSIVIKHIEASPRSTARWPRAAEACRSSHLPRIYYYESLKISMNFNF